MDEHKKIDKVIELLSEELDLTPLPGGYGYALSLAKDIDALKRAKELLKIHGYV